MLVLKIYNLDDNEKCAPVCSLPEGEHYLGRGETLNIDDKRVSRKHAQLIIRSDDVTIKSVHLNPCFFKASQGKSIQIIRKDESISLHDGDTFSLLADKYWYRVKIMLGNGEDCANYSESNISRADSVCSPTTNKRHHSDISSVTCKRKKLINDSDTLPTSQSSSLRTISNSQELTSPDVINDAPKIQGESNSLEFPTPQLSQTNSDITPEIYLEKESNDTGQLGIASPTHSAECRDTENVESIDQLESDDSQNLVLNIGENSIDGDVEKLVEVKKEKSEDEECYDKAKEELSASYGSINLAATVPMDDIAANNVEEKGKLEEIRVENLNNVTSIAKNVPRDGNDGQCASTTAAVSIVKEEVSNSYGSINLAATIPVDEIAANNVKGEDKLQDIKTEVPNNHPYTIKKEPIDGNGDHCATTSAAASIARRERCWYGAQCYRKNPMHRTDFSHPGDQDYDSDPNDDRPECPFGVTCYRKNVDHRKQFKHNSRPAPKPNTTGLNPPENDSSDNSSSDNDSSSETNGFGRKRRKAAKKITKYNETPEDDYDYEDPFINDGSSDDFELSEEDEGDTTDWDDSQRTDVESEDTKRLVTEAKKFTGKKKRLNRKKKQS